MQHLCLETQHAICSALEALEPQQRFAIDFWKHPGSGGGKTCLLQSGEVFDKAGVGVSMVAGQLSPAAIQAMMDKPHLHQQNITQSSLFHAVGISLVIHPRNPFVPTVHANYRYFECGALPGLCWFGGGSDLTPSYVDHWATQHFHQTLKTCCDEANPAYYPSFKDWCERYFYLPHRQETRGVGGIFFDNLYTQPVSQSFDFVANCARHFLPSYLPIVLKRYQTPFNTQHRQWQHLRRGRYVEFNLLYDRGTLFGLKAGGRVESIFLSLPLDASWWYNYQPAPGTPEADMQQLLHKVL
jgi:coproporphyrinogen III oxidase